MSGNYWRHPIVGYVTNFGYVYCTAHGVDQPGALGEKCGKVHVVDVALRDNGLPGTCDWPGCGAAIPVGGKPTEYVDVSLQANRR